MKHFIFSERGIYKLRLLSQAVLKKTGVRHRLSEPRSVMELLRYSSTTPDGAIFDHFCEFTQELDDKQRKYLAGRGLLLPSVIIDKINAYSEQRNAI
ncbi:MAG: hypothetical protein KTR20_14960 [Cellvibrionaceae bacterium]|nr:hypothetical protein [Cellvibrionaceae bacterium]